MLVRHLQRLQVSSHITTIILPGMRQFCSTCTEIINIRDKMDGSTKIRKNPIVLKLDTPEFKLIFTQELHDLVYLFAKNKYDIRIAGGAVRDLLMNKQPKDIDFATTATPDQMKEMFTKEGIRMINTKGEKHGTITPRINDKENFEVTTLRVDVLTDGRHAEVEFTTDWQLDANRRDLTINSMFLGFDGSVYDYFYGYEDLQKKRIVFVGDPATRIKEDFLRILRYFRFYGQIAETTFNHDACTLKTIKENVQGLQKISGERIWSEMKKILEGRFAMELMIEMINSGVSQYIGLPEKSNIEEFEKVCKHCFQFKKSLYAITLLTALLNSQDEVIKFHKRIKLSAFERDLALFIALNRKQTLDNEDILVYQKMCLQPNGKRDFVEELLRYNGKKDLYNELAAWKIPQFTLNGNILKEKGCPPGKVIGNVLNQLKLIWANGNFEISADDLINIHLPKILEEIKSGRSNKKIKVSK